MDELIERLRQRDEAALEELLVHCGPLLRYVIAPILPGAEDREDCLSEVLLKIWENVEYFDPDRGSWNGWLTAIARNTALNRARQDRRTEELTDALPSREPTPEEAVLRRERQAALEKALGQLKSRDQQLFYRKYYYRQSTAQIASELGLTERAVEGRLYRLKKHLRKLLGGEHHG